MPELRDIALLTNPTAGGGRGARAGLAALQHFRSLGVRVRVLVGRDADEAADLAHAAVRGGVDALVVAGGDGLANLGVQAVAETEVPFGIVPAGTGNDIARCLELPRRDPVAAAQRVVDGSVRRVDLARVGARYYVTVLAAGFDALVNERANRMSWPRGQMRYNLATLAELRTFRPLSYRLELDGVPRTLDAVLVAVGNSPSFGGGLRIAEGALVDDGLLDVIVIKPVGRAELLRTYPTLFSGTHITHPAYERIRVKQVTMAAPGVVGYADGERFGALPLTVECVPGALGVIS